jgi:hypothetical protein
VARAFDFVEGKGGISTQGTQGAQRRKEREKNRKKRRVQTKAERFGAGEREDEEVALE